MITRRHFLRYILGLPLFSFPLLYPGKLYSQTRLPSPGNSKRSIGEYFEGEQLNYEIAFWFFKRAAAVRLSFYKAEQPGRYIATLRGETLGIIGFFTRYRVDSYRAVMEEIDEGRRLRSLSYEEYVKIGEKVRRNIHDFDYQKRKWLYHSIRAAGRPTTEEMDIPEGETYDDLLTASYNFRYGVYGNIERDKNYTIATFPRKGVSSYKVKILPKEVEEHRRKSKRVREDSEYLIQLSLDPEVINSKEGIIEGWLSKDFCPVEGIIKNVILFGDVHGNLVTRKKQPGSTIHI